MKYRVLLFVLLICCYKVTGQNYIDYQHICNRVDDDVHVNDLQTAVTRFDTLFNNYQFIYGVHCFKALQIATKLNDEKRICKWLEKCIIQGVPLWMIRANDIVNPILAYSYTQSIIQSYDSVHRVYISNLDTVLAKRMVVMIEKDQRHTNKVNNGFLPFRLVYYPRWLRNNKKQLNMLINIVDSIGYPGEKLCGLPYELTDSTQGYSLFRKIGPSCIKHTYAQTMLMHAYSNPRKDIRDKLLKNIANGNMPASQYAIVADFMAQYGRKKHDYRFYYQWVKSGISEDTTIIDSRRHAIGLNTFQQSIKNAAMFLQQFKKKNVNKEILPE